MERVYSYNPETHMGYMKRRIVELSSLNINKSAQVNGTSSKRIHSMTENFYRQVLINTFYKIRLKTLQHRLIAQHSLDLLEIVSTDSIDTCKLCMTRKDLIMLFLQYHQYF